ncbi:hypothetical protein JQX13_50815 [Archangium violaceum]|uniref:hypothetical protein n=1 Tax=Archangium violaceum TaxID=83451 RepID=UPI00193B867B|nr:hypothetical protein [Archangium violaceum]QRK08150.1 hypothetical protein JQX13_50815 [Archangium violaceum]
MARQTASSSATSHIVNIGGPTGRTTARITPGTSTVLTHVQRRSHRMLLNTLQARRPIAPAAHVRHAL